MDDRKKINEWAKKQSYRLVVVIVPLPAGERFGYNLFVRNVSLDLEIKLGVEDDLKKAIARGDELRAFFGCPVKVQDTEARLPEEKKEKKKKR